ncbi:unnamed protein product, partial [Coccothraustes coccothraustes]
MKKELLKMQSQKESATFLLTDNLSSPETTRKKKNYQDSSSPKDLPPWITQYCPHKGPLNPWLRSTMLPNTTQMDCREKLSHNSQ